MAILKATLIFTFLVAGNALDFIPALDADDECSANTDIQCALNALQMKVRGFGPAGEGQGPPANEGSGQDPPPAGAGKHPSQWLPKVNKLLSSKLGEINGMISEMLKTKDPMPLDIKKKKVQMNKLFGVSSLHIDSFKATSITPPTATFALTAHWASELKLAGAAQARRGTNEFDVQLLNASFEASQIVATLDASEGTITKFEVSGVQVRYGTSTVNLKIKRRFLAMMLDGMINKKLTEHKTKIAGTIGAKITKVLDKAFNGKLKEAINKKLASKGDAPKTTPKTKEKGSDDKWLPEINTFLSSKQTEINGMLSHKLKAKDPMPVHIKKDKVDINQLFGISSLQIDSFKAESITPPTATFALQAHWGSELKLVGEAKAMGRTAKFNVLLLNASFETSKIVATLDTSAGTITKFGVSEVQVRYGSTKVHLEMRRRFFAMMVDGMVNNKLMEQKEKIAGAIAGKLTQVLNKVFNDKLKDTINKKLASREGASLPPSGAVGSDDKVSKVQSPKS